MYLIPTLQQIAHKTHQQNNQILFSTIGSVVDISKPLFRQKEGNFITEIKLIDETFNDSVQSTHLIKYLSVLLISDNKEELKFTSKVGDLIYLHKFMFSMWNGIKLKTKYYGGFESVYQIHSGQLQDVENFKIEKKIGKQNDSYDIDMISMRIVELKNWLGINFRKVFNPFYGVKIINNYCSLIEPFSISLRVHKFENNQFENYMFLRDKHDNNFYVNLKEFNHLLFKENEWIYLRGIKNINTDRQIIFTQTGNIIQLPQIFAQQYESQANYQAIYRKTNKIVNQKKQTTALTYISSFDQNSSTVKQLFDLQDKYKATSRKQDIILQNNYLVKGVVVKFKGNIKLYHTEYQMIVHDKYLDEIPTQEKKETIDDKKLVYVYEGTLYIIDTSIISKKEVLKIKMFTNDLKSTFFDQKELEKLNNFIGYSQSQKKIKETLSVINIKLEKLRQLSSFENPVSLVLQPIRSDQLVYRLINTKVV